MSKSKSVKRTAKKETPAKCHQLSSYLKVIAFAAVLGLSRAFGADPLEAGFKSPPDSAKPQTWWHWMNGNITKEGITADLEAMKRVGVGGAQIFNADCGIPAGPVKFNTPEWHELFKHAVREANRLGLQLCVHNCAGWSSSGGPWNTPEHAMQHVVTSEVRARGPAVFDAALPQPPVKLGFYRDIAVLAFKAPSAGTVKARDAAPAGSKLEIQSAAYEAEDGAGSIDVTTKLAALVSNGQVTVVANNGEMGDDPAFGHVKRLRVEYTLDGKPRTATVAEGETLRLPASAAPTTGETIPREGIMDLTARLAADGKLKWSVPPGEWIILRLGYTPTGQNNHPAPAEGTGPECDKFSREALDAHWAGFVQKLIADAGPLAGKSFNNVLIDSYEVGDQNWTAKFREEFKKRRGYDPLKFLPTLAGRVMDSRDISERFRWDMRRTIADLFAENYYGHFQELCHKSGLLASIEPYTGPFESLQSGRAADLVMGEFWSGSQGHPSVKLAASVAHIYGKQIVGAESFTASPESGRWQNDPWSIKPLGDLMYCTGLNRYIFHRYAMQPWTNRWPGMTMGQWGFHFERTVTWWEQGKAWLDYVARCQFLLQQGRFVADAAYFCGESAPVEMRVGHPPLPPGYDFDAINADVLLHRATVKNGHLTLPDGVSYSVLVLPPDDANMTPQLLRRIRDFVLDGLTVFGPPRPRHSPSLQDYPKCDGQVKSLADELWGEDDGKVHLAGKGAVIWNMPLADIFSEGGLKPDFQFKSESPGTKLVYCHRVAGGADIYFVSNQRRQFSAADCTFRVSGKSPELWHADTGVIEPAAIWSQRDGLTTVRIQFDPAGSVFVVFRRPAGGAEHVVAASGLVTQAPAAAEPKLEIKRAVYEATSGRGSMDVTATLAELAADGQTEIVVNNGEMGRDPAPNRVKRLRVEYTLDGKPASVTVAENETLALPTTAGRPLSPVWQVVNEAGRPLVKTSKNGTFELHTADGKVLKAAATDVPAPVEPGGEWDLKFPPNWGAPAQVRLDRLISWTDHADPGVRYFSGTATYEKEIEIPAEFFRNGLEIWLDLGAVKNFAEVSLNGRPLATLWKPPFRVNLTGVARAGKNQLQIKVTNLWPNRLIGDEQLPNDREWDGKQLKAWPQWLLDGKPSPTGRFTFTTWHHWTGKDALLESGLLGPVELEAVATIPAD